MSRYGTILVVEDDRAMRDALSDELKEARFDVLTAANGREALALLQQHPVDAVVTDLRMPEMTGEELLEQIRVRYSRLPVVILTAFGSIDLAVKTVKAGAYHFIPKPFHMEQLLVTLGSALEENRDLNEFQIARETGEKGNGLVAESLPMRRLVDVMVRASTVDTPVLVVGESGTGRELLARKMHDGNPRRKGRFLTVNCGAIPDPLSDEALFGYRRASSTDPGQDRPGMFHEAAGGTLYFEDIRKMTRTVQARLLRVLQAQEIVPVGSPVPVPVDVRVIAATDLDLSDDADKDLFRRDLLDRLSVITLRVPPLRDRKGDLLRLVAHLLKKHGERLGRPDRTVSVEAIQAMKRYSWPGNVRELEMVIERALVLDSDNLIGVEDLPESITGYIDPGVRNEFRSVASMEKEHIMKTLEAVAGNKTAAAKALGLDRKTLYRKLKHYKIET